MSLVPPRSLHFEIHLGWRVCAHSRDTSVVENNFPEGGRTVLYKWLNHLFTVLHLTRGGLPHSFSPVVYLCLASMLAKQTASLCALLLVILLVLPRWLSWRPEARGVTGICLQYRSHRRHWFLGCEDALEESMATHSSILAWRIPWTQEPGRL